MPQVVIRCPFHIFELAHKFGVEPATFPHFFGPSDPNPSGQISAPADSQKDIPRSLGHGSACAGAPSLWQ